MQVFFNIVSSPMLSPPIEEPVPGEPSQTRVRIPMSCDGPVQDIDKGTHAFFLSFEMRWSIGRFCVHFSVCRISLVPRTDGVECEVFDIVFNPETISKSTEDPVFRQFVLEVSLENIRQKLDKELEPSMPTQPIAHLLFTPVSSDVPISLICSRFLLDLRRIHLSENEVQGRGPSAHASH